MFMAIAPPMPYAPFVYHQYRPSLACCGPSSLFSFLDVFLLFMLLPLLPSIIIVLVPLALKIFFVWVVTSVIVSSLCFTYRGVCYLSRRLKASCHSTGSCTTGKRPAESGSCKTKEEVKDWSSVRVDVTDESVTVTVAAPGVRHTDLKVSVEDGKIVVAGQTTKGSGTFRVSRRVAPPSVADLDSAVATHADGELVVTMERKPIKRIQVSQASRKIPVPQGVPQEVKAATTSSPAKEAGSSERGQPNKPEPAPAKNEEEALDRETKMVVG